jgi:maltose alpha-D-glucosyltransferase/alpha-amylase
MNPINPSQSEEDSVNKIEPALRSEIIQSQLTSLFDSAGEGLKMSSLTDLTGKRFGEILSKNILPQFLRRTRWFAGKGRNIGTVYIEDYVEMRMASDEALILLIEVRYTQGSKEFYQLPVCFLTEEQLCECWPGPRHAVLAPAQVNNIEGFIADATCSPSFRNELLKKFLHSGSPDSEALPLAFVLHQKDIIQSVQDQESRVLHAEQSNTSIVYGDRLFLKLYRKVGTGINSEIEVSRFLAEHTSFRQTPRWLGEMQWKRTEGKFAFGILQTFVKIQSDGWSYFMKLLTQANRDVLTSSKKSGLGSDAVAATQKASARPLREEAEKMALCTASMHKALGSAKSIPEFSPEPMTNEYYDLLCAGLQVKVESAFNSLRSRLQKMSGQERDEAWLLLQQFDHICDWITDHNCEVDGAMRIRVHGDFHLGQLLFDGANYLVTDFEGEPGQPLHERRTKHSALKDVAGMLRSFHYAAYASVLLDNAYNDNEIDRVMPILQQWFEEMKEAYLRRYIDEMATTGLLPVDQHKFETLLNIYLLDKALYELEYELNNRPSWAIIPLVGIRAVVGELMRDQLNTHID